MKRISALRFGIGMRASARLISLGLALLVIGRCSWAVAPIALVPGVPPVLRSPSTTLPWLSVKEGRLVDERDRSVLLRGFNSTALLEWPTQPAAPLEAADADLMHRAGFNVVRLGIAWSRLEPERGRVDSVYLQEVVDTVELLNRHGLYVILDMHMTLSWSPRFGGAGAPEWASLPLVPHIVWGEIGDWPEAFSPAVFASNAYFWLAPDWQADLIFVWREVVARFREVSGVVGYDLFNEPVSGPTPPGLFEEHSMWPMYARMIEGVGGVDPNHLFIVEAPLLLIPPALQIGPRIVPLTAPNLVYSPHEYTASIIPPYHPEDPTRLAMHIREQAREASQLAAIAWWGEIGIDTGKTYAIDWADAALDAFDDLQVGWAWWQWRQEWGWGVRNLEGDFHNPALLAHLARPFAAAAPSGVSAQRGNGLAGTLTLAVSADHQDLPISVSWPSATLAAPIAEGGCVVGAYWRREQARLDLELQNGAGCTIHLTASR